MIWNIVVWSKHVTYFYRSKNQHKLHSKVLRLLSRESVFNMFLEKSQMKKNVFIFSVWPRYRSAARWLGSTALIGKLFDASNVLLNFQRRRRTVETSLSTPSLPSRSATLLLLLLHHMELLRLCHITWLHPPCTVTSPVTAARVPWWEPVLSAPCVPTTTCAHPARLKGLTPSTLCCPSGTHCRWGASWEKEPLWCHLGFWVTSLSQEVCTLIFK